MNHAVQNDIQGGELQIAASNMVSEEEEDSGENNSGRNPALAVPLAALRFVTRLASGIFSRGKNSDPNGLDSKDENDVQPQDSIMVSEGRDCSYESSSQKSNVVDCRGTEIDHGNGEEHVGPGTMETLDATETVKDVRIEGPDATECNGDDPCSFKRFDIAKDPMDHYFLGANGQVFYFKFNLYEIEREHVSVILKEAIEGDDLFSSHGRV